MSSQAIQETLVSATTAAAQASVQADPVLVGLAWLLGIVTFIIAIGKPIRDYLRQENRADKADIVGDAKSSAEAVLYNHLAEQVTEYRRIADEAFRERNTLISRVAALEAKAAELDRARELTEQLQLLLVDKDAHIQELLASASSERTQFLLMIQARDDQITAMERRGQPRVPARTPAESLPDPDLIG